MFSQKSVIARDLEWLLQKPYFRCLNKLLFGKIIVRSYATTLFQIYLTGMLARLLVCS